MLHARHPDPRAGAMYQINMLVWPLVFGVAGHVWGAALGHPWPGVAAGVLLGLVTAVPMLRASFYDVEIVAPFLLLGLFVVPPSLDRWYVLIICALPWARLGVAVVLPRARGDGPSS